MDRHFNFRWLIACVLLSLAAPGLAVPAGWSPLLEPAALAEILDRSPEVRVVRVTGDYEAGHIPSAVGVSYSRFRGPGNNPGALPDMAALTALVQELGISAETPVVVVHGGASAADMGAAARVYWTLKSLGVKDLAILNGGFEAWRRAQLPVTTAVVEPAPSDFVPTWQGDWQVGTEDLEGLVDGGTARLIDARPASFFEGTRASSARPGTIRGAANLSFTSWFGGNSLMPAAELNRVLEAGAQGDASLTVSFCNTGHLAAINWFVMSELAGVENTRLYPESMTEWTMADRPMDNEPNRLRHYWDMTTRWFTELTGS
ncbi:sulfurtransferase [Gilvimarinus sp. F26214L]|uniref:sulfurtransferase n=1 Tax=Gilvimarinus sp. DZF01 TaxID=3461371 RepID=UPI00404681B0